jgi:hypothetical protein
VTPVKKENRLKMVPRWTVCRLAGLFSAACLCAGSSLPLGAAETPRPAAGQPPTALLRSLLPDLEKAKAAPAVPGPQSQTDVPAAQSGNPIEKIGSKMRRLAQILREQSAKENPQTEPLQQQIIKQLNALLEELRKQAQQQSSTSSSSSPRQGQGKEQKDSRSSVGKSLSQVEQKSAHEQQDSNQPARDSTERLGNATPRINLAELVEVIKDVWGHLPEKDRERLRQLSADQVMPGHDVAVEKYFRRLAEDADRKNSSSR